MKLALATKICNMHEGQLEAALRLGEGITTKGHFITSIEIVDIREKDVMFQVIIEDDMMDEGETVVKIFVSEENGQIVGKY